MQTTNSSARERILGRIRAANSRHNGEAASILPIDGIFPPIADPRQKFLDEASVNLTEVFVTSNVAQSQAALTTILATVPEGELFIQDDPSLRALTSSLGQQRTVRISSEGAPAEATQATITLAHGFVAQTGSIISSSACGGRGASIVPPCHIVYGYGRQILPDITAALELIQRELASPSYVGLITGSSRTADIEKILVQGAHGPRRLAVILEG